MKRPWWKYRETTLYEDWYGAGLIVGLMYGIVGGFALTIFAEWIQGRI